MGGVRAAAAECGRMVLSALARPSEIVDERMPRRVSIPFAVALAAAPLSWGAAGMLASVQETQRAISYLSLQLRDRNPVVESAVRSYAGSGFYNFTGSVVSSKGGVTVFEDASHGMYWVYGSGSFRVRITGANRIGLASELVHHIEAGETYSSGGLVRMLGSTDFGYGTGSRAPEWMVAMGICIWVAEVASAACNLAIIRDAKRQVKLAQDMLDHRWTDRQDT